MRFSKYGSAGLDGLTLEELKQDPDIQAEAVESGCEGTYVEIAKWSETMKQWYRYAFAKFLGGEDGTERDGKEIAEDIALQINGRNRQGFVYNMENWKDEYAAKALGSGNREPLRDGCVAALDGGVGSQDVG